MVRAELDQPRHPQQIAVDSAQHFQRPGSLATREHIQAKEHEIEKVGNDPVFKEELAERQSRR